MTYLRHGELPNEADDVVSSIVEWIQVWLLEGKNLSQQIKDHYCVVPMTKKYS